MGKTVKRSTGTGRRRTPVGTVGLTILTAIAEQVAGDAAPSGAPAIWQRFGR